MLKCVLRCVVDWRPQWCNMVQGCSFFEQIKVATLELLCFPLLALIFFIMSYISNQLHFLLFNGINQPINAINQPNSNCQPRERGLVDTIQACIFLLDHIHLDDLHEDCHPTRWQQQRQQRVSIATITKTRSQSNGLKIALHWSCPLIPQTLLATLGSFVCLKELPNVVAPSKFPTKLATAFRPLPRWCFPLSKLRRFC